MYGAYHPLMSTPDARTFLDAERAAWRPFEALMDLSDDQLTAPVEALHGWTGRQLMAHLLTGHDIALAVATELAAGETSPARERWVAEWDARGGDAVNAELDAIWARRSMDELRDRFATQPDRLRRALADLPERRWLGDAELRSFFRSETADHYADHREDLAALLAAVDRGPER